MSEASPVVTYGHRGSLVRTGGALGIAADIIGLAVFFGACAGFRAALVLSILPLILAAPGLVLTIIGAVRKERGVEDTQTLSAMFVNIIGLIGGLLELAVWQGWPLMHTTGSA